MKLDIDIIKKITLGAVKTEEIESGIRFFRFTDEQKNYYDKRPDSSTQHIPPAGIKLSFKTDSKTLYIKITVSSPPVRKYFSLDVFKNGEALGYIDNYDGISLDGNYAERDYPMGEFGKTFSLGEGEKHICIYLPFSVDFVLNELSVDDGSYAECEKPSKKLLAFGDSITQGYDSLRPSQTYTSMICNLLNAEEFNKGFGGEVFCPALSELPDNFTPDIITVAYGTNSFYRNRDGFSENCISFFENLLKIYEGVKIFAITPIWRKDLNAETSFGNFYDIEKEIINCTENMSNVIVIKGGKLVPQKEEYFGDLRLHPTGDGFKFYAENLYNEIKKYL